MLVEVLLIKLIHQLCVVPIGDGDLVKLCKGVCGPNSLTHIIVLCEVLCHIHIDVLWVIGEVSTAEVIVFVSLGCTSPIAVWNTFLSQ